MGSSTGRIAFLAAAAMCGAWQFAWAEEGAVTPASHRAKRGESFDQVLMVRELMRQRGGEAAAAAQLVQLCRGFAPADAAAAFEALAVAHEAAGAVDLAADARLMLVRSYPDEPLARQALLWLTRLYASREVAHRYRPPGQGADPDGDRGTALYAYHLADEFARTGEKRELEPALVFARAVAARRAGLARPAATLMASLKHSRAEDEWGRCAELEDWLRNSDGEAAPKGVMRCVRAAEAPTLDGVLDEACWVWAVDGEEGGEKSAKPRAAVARWAWDREYLYLAVRCAKVEGVAYPRDARERVRDADLTALDHVRVAIDVDRDYATCFELTVDSRGWTRDACWGDAGWDPEWFVASGETDEAWVAEAAIALEQLGEKGAAAGAAWGVAVERALPRDGAKPHELGGPERFGVLVLE